MKILGYARVSTRDQNLEMQLDALNKFGCNEIYQEKMSGRLADRPVFKEVTSKAEKGDMIVVWKVDRLGRSAKNICEVLEEMKTRGVIIVSLTEGINTETPLGVVFCQIAGIFAELEISNRSERTREGLKAAKKKGKRLGRPKGYATPDSIMSQIQEDFENKVPRKELAAKYGLSESTVYRYQKDYNNKKYLNK